MNQRWFGTLLLFLIFLTTATWLKAQAEDLYVQNAQKFITALADHEFDEAVSYFDDDMRKSLSSEQLAEMWDGVQKQFGDYEEQLSASSQAKEGLNIVFVTCEFARKKIDMQIAFRSDLKIAGLWIVPTEL